MKRMLASLVAAATFIAAEDSVAPIGVYTPARAKALGISAATTMRRRPPFTLAADKAW